MSESQVTSYVEECIGEHLRPDALSISRIKGNQLRLVTRKTGTFSDGGEVFIITITMEEKKA